MVDTAKIDENSRATLTAVSNVDGVSIVRLWADPVSHRLLVDLPSGAGTVTSVSVVTANGISGTVATATTTPAITLTLGAITPTSVNGTTSTEIGYVSGVTSAIQTQLNGKQASGSYEVTTNKDATGGYVGLTLFKINFKNALNTITSFFTNANTIARTYTFQDRDGTIADNTDLALKAPLASPTFTGTVTVPTPVNTTDASTKAYVDAVAQGLAVKPSAIVATTTVLDANTYANGASGVGATLTGVATGTLTVDGHIMALNDFILVKNEVATANNGLYKVTVAGAIGVAYVLTRDVNMDSSTEFQGAFVFVESGTVNASAGFVCTASASITVGTTAVAFQQFSGAGEITASTGLTKTGNTLAIDTAVTVDKTTAQTLTNKRKQPRVYSIANNASLTPEIDTYDIFHLTAMSANTTINNKSTSTPADGELMEFRFLDNATARTLTWGTDYVAKAGVALPSTTVISKNMVVLFEWNANLAKFNLLSVGNE
jgi:hypothetical protein